MDPDLALGERLAELRKRKGKRQDELLDLLAARGVNWTQATLSRIESGKRALKVTELFALTDALGIEAGELNPATNHLYYRIQSLRIRLQEAKDAAAVYTAKVQRLRNQLVALSLADRLLGGESVFTVHGSAEDFADLLSQAHSPQTDRWQVDVALDLLGMSYDELWEEFQRLASSEFPDVDDTAKLEDDAHSRLMSVAYSNLFAHHYPDLTFTNEDDTAAFEVDGIVLDETTPRRSLGAGLASLFPRREESDGG